MKIIVAAAAVTKEIVLEVNQTMGTDPDLAMKVSIVHKCIIRVLLVLFAKFLCVMFFLEHYISLSIIFKLLGRSRSKGRSPSKGRSQSKGRSPSKRRSRSKGRYRSSSRQRSRSRNRSKASSRSISKNRSRTRSRSNSRSRSSSRRRSWSRSRSYRPTARSGSYRSTPSSSSHLPGSSSSSHRTSTPSWCSSRSRSRSSRYTSKSDSSANKAPTERDEILSKWRKNFCNTEKQLSDKLEELAAMSLDDIVEREKKVWTRSTPAELYYVRDETDMKVIKATPKLVELLQRFEDELVKRAEKVNEDKPKYEPPPRKNRARLCKHKSKISFL